ncbi:MAG: nitrogen fixation protein NifZ [Rhodoblastus sp.]
MGEPKYALNQPVRATADLVNDGSYPDVAPDALLAAAGALGEIIKIGHQEETSATVYLVEFGERAIGCFENELTAA